MLDLIITASMLLLYGVLAVIYAVDVSFRGEPEVYQSLFCFAILILGAVEIKTGFPLRAVACVLPATGTIIGMIFHHFDGGNHCV